MDTPVDEQKKYHSVTRKIAATESELSEPNELSIDSIVFVSIDTRLFNSTISAFLPLYYCVEFYCIHDFEYLLLLCD